MSHSQTTAYVNKVENNCTSTLCNAPDVAPVTRKGALCIIHDFIFEKYSIFELYTPPTCSVGVRLWL